MNPSTGLGFEKAIVETIFGKRDVDWFDVGRIYHGSVCEQRVRLPRGEIRTIFFDESQFSHSIPLPDEAREILQTAATKTPLPDATLISRFPLVEFKAKTAADAGRIVLTHINQARAQGWRKGNTYFFVDGWRLDQELFRGFEKTVMMFDMRPALVSAAGTDIIGFCACDSFEAIDQVERRMRGGKSDQRATTIRKPKLNWRGLLVTAIRFGLIAAAVAGLIALVGSRSFLTAAGIAAGAFGIIVLWMLCQGLRFANMSVEEHCKEQLRLKYSSLGQDILKEYVEYIEGTPRDRTRWARFTNNGQITTESFKQLEQNFEDWLKRSPY